VKHYSSGMYMRLAFTVAAHLEPEILVVDEVLAVGDAQFQKKCLGKMEDVAKQGRTVLFVSHNMPSVERLCQQCVLLRQGSVERIGNPTAIISHYLTSDLPGATTDIPLSNHRNRTVGSNAVMSHLRITSPGQAGSVVPMGGTLVIEVAFDWENTNLSPV